MAWPPSAGSWSVTGDEPDIAQETYRAAVEHSVDGVLITVPDGRILYANPAACAMLGATAEEVTRTGRQGFTPVGDPRWERALDERARTGRARLVAPMIRRDGSRFLAELTSSIFTEAQGALRAIVIIRDVTGRVRLEERSAALHEITSALLSATDTAQVLTLIANRARRLLDASDAAIFTPLNNPGFVKVAAVDGPGMSGLAGRIYPPGSLVGRAMANRESLLVGDLTAAAATADGRRLGLGPGIVVPVVAGDQAFGVLLVGSQPGSQPYGNRELQDLELFAEATGVALAMEQARSHLELYHRRTTQQLQDALSSRVSIEQAKGFIAATRRISTEEAFQVLRRYARHHGENLHKVAEAVVDGKVVV